MSDAQIVAAIELHADTIVDNSQSISNGIGAGITAAGLSSLSASNFQSDTMERMATAQQEWYHNGDASVCKEWIAQAVGDVPPAELEKSAEPVGSAAGGGGALAAGVATVAVAAGGILPLLPATSDGLERRYRIVCKEFVQPSSVAALQATQVSSSQSLQAAHESIQSMNWRDTWEDWKAQRDKKSWMDWVVGVLGLAQGVYGLYLMNQYQNTANKLIEHSQSASNATYQRFVTAYEDRSDPGLAAIFGVGGTKVSNVDAQMHQTHTWMRECADYMKNKYENEYGGIDSEIRSLWLNNINEVGDKLAEYSADLNAWANDHRRVYESEYAPGETQLAPVLLSQGKCLYEKACALRDKMQSCSEDMLQVWSDAYQAGEQALAPQTLNDARNASAHQILLHDWVVAERDARQAYYEGVYEPGETPLAVTALATAKDMVLNMVSVYDWFRDHSDDMQKFWDLTYRDKEAFSAPEIIEAGGHAAIKTNDWADWLHDRAKQYLEFWETVYEAPERHNMPIVIDQSSIAAVDNTKTHKWETERKETLWDYWDKDWYPCDSHDLLRTCAIWGETDPMHEFHSNSDLARDLADHTYKSYTEVMLPCEVKRAKEICAMEPYERKFCEIENRAMLHARKVISQQREKIKRCGSRYCGNATDEKLMELSYRQAQVETAALQAAHRHEQNYWVENENRRHRYHQDIFNVAEQHPKTTLDGLRVSDTGHDLIMQHLQNRIVRGYEYLNHSERYGQLSQAGRDTAHRSGLAGVELGHSWPRLSTQTQNIAVDDLNAIVRNAIGMVNSGHFFPDLANKDQFASMQTANREVGFGQNAVGQGHKHLGLAGEREVQGIRSSEISHKSGLSMTQLGHFYPELAYKKAANAMSATQDGARVGVSAIDQGQEWAMMADRAKESSRDAAQNVLNSTMQMQDVMLKVKDLAMKAKKIELDATQGLLYKMLDTFLTEPHMRTTAINQATGAAAGAAIDMLDRAGSFSSGGFAAAGSSWEALHPKNTISPSPMAAGALSAPATITPSRLVGAPTTVAGASGTFMPSNIPVGGADLGGSSFSSLATGFGLGIGS